MNKDLNLAELTKKITCEHTKAIDGALATYLQSAVQHLTDRGEKIEDYTLCLIQNPMMAFKDGFGITQQWKIMKMSELDQLKEKIQDV